MSSNTEGSKEEDDEDGRGDQVHDIVVDPRLSFCSKESPDACRMGMLGRGGGGGGGGGWRKRRRRRRGCGECLGRVGEVEERKDEEEIEKDDHQGLKPKLVGPGGIEEVDSPIPCACQERCVPDEDKGKARETQEHDDGQKPVSHGRHCLVSPVPSSPLFLHPSVHPVYLLRRHLLSRLACNSCKSSWEGRGGVGVEEGERDVLGRVLHRFCRQ